MKKFLIPVLFLTLFLPTAVLANPITSGLLQGVPCAQPAAGWEVQNCGFCDLIRVLINASNIIVAFSGAIALLMFVYAGVLMIISYAYPAGISKAKDTIKYAIIGLFFIFAGYTVINFILMAFGGYSNMSVFTSAYQGVTHKSVEQWGVCKSIVNNN